MELSELVADGRIGTIALGAILAEAAVLLVFWRAAAPLVPRAHLANLVSGLCLILALRAALTGAAPVAIVAFLSGAFLAHIADVALRWRHGRQS